jgi:hypothetical protein
LKTSPQLATYNNRLTKNKENNSKATIITMYIETNKTKHIHKMKKHHKQGNKNKMKGENLINLKRKA